VAGRFILSIDRAAVTVRIERGTTCQVVGGVCVNGGDVPAGRTRVAAAALAAIMVLVAATAVSGCGIVDRARGNLANNNNPVVAATESSVVNIGAVAPSCQKLLEGSGFVVSDHTVMSNAHVVAGSNSVTVQDTDGNSYDATVVSYDPGVDIAILDVPGLPAPPLAFANAPAATGTDALVMGFPDAGSFEATPARIREVVELNGPDIYRTTTVTRQVYTISGTVRQGDSGGPLLDLNGQVLGVVFGMAVDDPDTGFVMTAEQVSGELQNIGNTTAVATGSCIS
jgi:S1-C subfamily serine protease